MSHPKNPKQDGKPDFSPQAQADESHGTIKGSQLNDRNDPELDTARGSENAAGLGGGGPHKPGRHR